MTKTAPQNRIYSTILSTGSYLPEKILTNFDLEKMVDTTNEWIVQRTGIHKRHIAAEHETAVSMAEIAARRALEEANVKPEELGMIIVTSTTPQMVFPSTACLLQDRFKIAGCPAFDLNGTACSAFMYALSIADQYIQTGTVKYVLVVASELMSRIVDWTDRTTCVLFGDGAGAFLLGASDKPGIISTHIHADGAHKDMLYLRMGTPSAPNFETMQMHGNQLFKIAVNTLDDLFDETLAANNIDKADIDWLIPHQANVRIIEAMAKKLSLPISRVAVTLGEQGNTSSASIPLALDFAIKRGEVRRGQLLLLEGFGGGLAWGSALIRY